MEPITTSVAVATAIVTSKAYKIFEDVIYRKIYNVSREELEASNREKAKDIIAVKEATRDLVVRSEVIKLQREYKNLGKTLNLTSLYITAEENKLTEENDFFWNLLEHSKEISNSEMQALIAKIIAGEYNNPTTYSMSTLQVLKSLDYKLLNDFTIILGVSLANTGIFRDIFSNLKTMKDLNVSYRSLLDLQDIGLISSNESEVTNTEGKITDIYTNKQIQFTAKSEIDKTITTPVFYSLTRAGREIARHLNIVENPNFTFWLKENYQSRNFNVGIE